MPMNTQELALFNAEGVANNDLEDKKAAFATARANVQSSNTALETARAALDAAWVNARTKDSDLNNVVFVAPEGYTPPS
jgi:hypothetical protein